MKSRNLFVAIVAPFIAVACSKEQPPQPEAGTPPELSSPVAVEVSGGNPDAEQAAELTADYMRDIVVEISSDAYEGRGPGSRGDIKARDYLAAEMQRLGLQPGAADGTWEQKFDLVGVTTSQPLRRPCPPS